MTTAQIQATPKVDIHETVVAIRAKAPTPKRLSRQVLMAGALAAGLVIALSLISGLSERPDQRNAAKENAVSAAGGPPESILQAKSDYAVSDLAPTSPGPTAEDVAAAKAMLGPPSDSAFANTPPPPPSNPSSLPARSSSASYLPHPSSSPPSTRESPDMASHASPLLFANRGAREGLMSKDEDRLANRLSPPRSRFELQAGHIIPAALVTALNADLSGRVVAQVTAPVYDSITGAYLLIPQGSRLIGTYQSGARYGDERIFLSWNRLILPNGWSINLQGMEATDATGAAGLADRTDNRLDRLAGAVALSSILSVVANRAEDRQSGGFTQSLGDAAAQQAAQTGARIIDRDLAVRPTLRVREGAPVRVLVSRDIQLKPYRDAR